jgi:hypothetical protein
MPSVIVFTQGSWKIIDDFAKFEIDCSSVKVSKNCYLILAVLKIMEIF